MLKEHNAQKEPFQGEAIEQLLKTIETVIVASGKKIIEFQIGNEDRPELLKKITGRTGNLRAPTLRCEKQLFVGFNVDLYQQIVTM